MKQGLLEIPILYFSRYINKNKADYYRLFQSVREGNDWESWILFILNGVEETSQQTIVLVKRIKTLMQDMKQKIRSELPKIYSQDLLNNLFRHPYTKNEFVMNELQVTRQTAAKYLDELVDIGLLQKHKVSKENFYLNYKLYDLLQNVNELHKGDRKKS